MKIARLWTKRLGLAMFAAIGWGLAAEAAPGDLVAVIVSKGQFRGDADVQGMDALAKSAHQNGFPVTWMLKPETAGQAKDRLVRWHRENGGRGRLVRRISRA